MYLPRTIEKRIRAASRHFPVLVLTGGRQVGKTTLLKQLSGPERRYVTLDDPRLLSLAREDPALFLQRFSPPVLIDEIQYAPGLLPLIKMQVDEDRKPGAFWLTGSQQFHLMKGVSESLAGRAGVLQLLGLSRRELAGGPASPPFIPDRARERASASSEPLTLRRLYRALWRGAFPAIAAAPKMDRDLFYGSYLQTYLHRDVRDLARVGDELAFTRFLRASAARTGQLLNLADLARDADIAPNTAKSWLSILETSGVVWLLPAWHSNLTKRLVKSPKLYFYDTGLCAYLTEWSSPETLEAGAMSGSILETWIAGELLKSYVHNGVTPNFYYYRDKDNREIDLLIVRDNVIYPIECKKTANPSTNDARLFAAVTSPGMKVGRGGVICLIDQWLPLTEKNFAIPVAAL
jgi:uncharacterized protein